jgi:hypothetical protein
MVGNLQKAWIPAFAGMTRSARGDKKRGGYEARTERWYREKQM